jgi:hypothetical protein
MTLIHEGHFEDAAYVIQGFFAKVRVFEDWADLLNLIEHIPIQARSNSAVIAVVYAEILAQNNKYDYLLSFTADILRIWYEITSRFHN